MAGTYSKIYLHIVFAVKGRKNQLDKKWRDEVFKYMAGIIENKNHKSIIVNGVEDHVHVFVGFKPSMNISDLVRDIKNNSSKYINERRFINEKFNWQEGYGVFSYAESQINNVYRYILNQEEHHRKKNFKTEYIDLLNKYKVDFDEKYLFDFFN